MLSLLEGYFLTYFNSTGLLTCWRLDGETCLGVGAYARWLETITGCSIYWKVNFDLL